MIVMKKLVFILDAVNTPLSTERTNQCLAMCQSWDENNIRLNNEIHVTETAKGYAVIVHSKNTIPLLDAQLIAQQKATAANHDIRWLDIKSDYIMFGLKAS
jgi:hypothetical protein